MVVKAMMSAVATIITIAEFVMCSAKPPTSSSTDEWIVNCASGLCPPSPWDSVATRLPVLLHFRQIAKRPVGETAGDLVDVYERSSHTHDQKNDQEKGRHTQFPVDPDTQKDRNAKRRNHLNRQPDGYTIPGCHRTFLGIGSGCDLFPFSSSSDPRLQVGKVGRT